MASRKKTVRVELEEQRCLIEQQQIEIQRHRHKIETQRRRMAHLEAKLDGIKAPLNQPLPSSPPTQRRPSNGGRHSAAPHPGHETSSSDDQT